jgi:hypothetical protein
MEEKQLLIVFPYDEQPGLSLVVAAEHVVLAHQNPKIGQRGGVLICSEADGNGVFQEVEHFNWFPLLVL